MKSNITSTLILLTVMLTACDRPLPPSSPYGAQGNGYQPVQQAPYSNNQSALCSPPFLVNQATKIKLEQPYNAGGERFFPISDPRGFVEEGEAAWYGKKFHGNLTASGEVYNQNAMTAAHPGLPMNTCIKVTNLRNNTFVYLRVNDRGPSVNRRVLDVSAEAAKRLDFYRAGITRVHIEVMY